MRKSRSTDEQIVAMLREAERTSVAETAQAVGGAEHATPVYGDPGISSMEVMNRYRRCRACEQQQDVPTPADAGVKTGSSICNRQHINVVRRFPLARIRWSGPRVWSVVGS